jgi:hypothetical protein
LDRFCSRQARMRGVLLCAVDTIRGGNAGSAAAEMAGVG